MTMRDDLFQKFGPLLIEAIALATLDQINALRSKAGLPQITPDRAMIEISNHLSHLDPYPWMEGPTSDLTITQMIKAPTTPMIPDQPTGKLSSLWRSFLKLISILRSED